MKERILKIQLSNRRGKKYMAVVSDGTSKRNIHFGAKGWGQWKDSTLLRAYKGSDHGDPERRRRYFLRHSGVPSKREAIAREVRRSRGRYTAKLLSHRYLW